jgi:signal transduction histidine kinase
VVITFANITPIKQSEESLRSLNETLEHRVAQRTAMVELLQEVTRAANEADSVGDIMRWALERIGQFNHWPIGFGYLIDSDAADHLAPIETWHVDNSPQYESFVQATLARRPIQGEDVPGLTWQRGELISINDLSKTANFLRRKEAAALGLRAALAFPILIKKEVVGVLEFFAKTSIEQEPNLLSLLRAIGQQLGRVVERSRQQRELDQAMWLEQRHLGEELHDTVSQELTGLAMLAKTAQNNLEEQNSPQAAHLDEIGVGLRTVTAQVREIARGLFPVSIDPRGLSAALAALVAKTEQRYGIPCTLLEDSAAIPDSNVATHFFRIAQEAITNAVKHGDASNIQVSLKGKDPVVLRVSNDGNKFEPDRDAALGMGLRIMRHRADLIGATLNIEALDGETVVSCALQK